MRLRVFRLLFVLAVAVSFAAAQIPATDDSYTASSSGSGRAVAPSSAVTATASREVVRRKAAMLGDQMADKTYIPCSVNAKSH